MSKQKLFELRFNLSVLISLPETPSATPLPTIRPILLFNSSISQVSKSSSPWDSRSSISTIFSGLRQKKFTYLGITFWIYFFALFDICELWTELWTASIFCSYYDVLESKDARSMTLATMTSYLIPILSFYVSGYVFPSTSFSVLNKDYQTFLVSLITTSGWPDRTESTFSESSESESLSFLLEQKLLRCFWCPLALLLSSRILFSPSNDFSFNLDAIYFFYKFLSSLPIAIFSWLTCSILLSPWFAKWSRLPLLLLSGELKIANLFCMLGEIVSHYSSFGQSFAMLNIFFLSDTWVPFFKFSPYPS